MLTELQVWFVIAKSAKDISDVSAWRARKTWQSYQGYLRVTGGKSEEDVLKQLRIVTDPDELTAYMLGRSSILSKFIWIFYPVPKKMWHCVRYKRTSCEVRINDHQGTRQLIWKTHGKVCSEKINLGIKIYASELSDLQLFSSVGLPRTELLVHLSLVLLLCCLWRSVTLIYWLFITDHRAFLECISTKNILNNICIIPIVSEYSWYQTEETRPV